MDYVSKSIDVKIKIVYPQISRTIPNKDSAKIRETNFAKYEPQKTIAAVQSTAAVFTPKQEEDEWTKSITNEMKELEYDLARLERMADKKLKDKKYTYDVKDPKNDPLLEAEKAIFGSASGVITYDMFKEVLCLKDAIDQMVAEETIVNGGFKFVA